MQEDRSVYIPVGEKNLPINPAKISFKLFAVRAESDIGEDYFWRYESVYAFPKDKCNVKIISTVICIFLLCSSVSGCIWVTVGIVGAAVIGANINEIQEYNSNSTSTDSLDEHLSHKKKVDEALSGNSGQISEPLDTEEVIETYGSRINN